MKVEEFSALQYGMFIHYGLYSSLARGEWVMNREQIAPQDMRTVPASFRPEKFDAEAICDLAVEGGMRYIVFTTMHHEGFRLYDSALSDFNAMKYWGRDLVKEMVCAARKRGLKIGLYHSLNNWFDQPDAVEALEDKNAYERFIGNTFARLKELVTLFDPIDILWYDGWWPFNREGWKALKMNEEMRRIQSHLLFNGRNGLPGDFGTPEQHLTAPDPWRPWEACVTLNDHWGYHAGDQHWKDSLEVVNMLLTCGSGHGNLLLNIGPRGDGSIPEESVRIIRQVGRWLKEEGGFEAIDNCENFSFSPVRPQSSDRGDWDPQGRFTVSGNNLFMTLKYFPGNKLTLTGLQCAVQKVFACGKMELNFTQSGTKVVVDLPDELEKHFAPVLRFECSSAPALYRTGGMRVPECEHPRYDPVPPDIQYEK